MCVVGFFPRIFHTPVLYYFVNSSSQLTRHARKHARTHAVYQFGTHGAVTRSPQSTPRVESPPLIYAKYGRSDSGLSPVLGSLKIGGVEGEGGGSGDGDGGGEEEKQAVNPYSLSPIPPLSLEADLLADTGELER